MNGNFFSPHHVFSRDTRRRRLAQITSLPSLYFLISHWILQRNKIEYTPSFQSKRRAKARAPAPRTWRKHNLVEFPLCLHSFVTTVVVVLSGDVHSAVWMSGELLQADLIFPTVTLITKTQEMSANNKMAITVKILDNLKLSATQSRATFVLLHIFLFRGTLIQV